MTAAVPVTVAIAIPAGKDPREIARGLHYRMLSDPGHGWLRVPHTVITLLGIADQISRFSYLDLTYAYLEEDCDLSVFLDALGLDASERAAWWRDHVVERHTDRDSFVRALMRWGVG